LVDTIWVVDAKSLSYEYITESVEALSGYSADEFMTMSLRERMTPESFNKVESLLLEEKPKFDKRIKSIRSIEAELIKKNGIPYWCEIRARLIKDADGSLKIVGVAKDISERKRIEQEKNELLEKLGLALAEKEKLKQENKKLKKLLLICSECKRILDDHGKWWPLDSYIEKYTETKMSHTICPDCSDNFYGEQDWYKKMKKKNSQNDI
jgi:PAS domain S-box-containing protein